MNIEKELKENPKAFEKIDYETYKEHVVVRNDSYRPFSNEWKESLMELTKEQLVEQLKNNIIENMQLKETQIGKANQVERLVMPTEAEPQDGGWVSVEDRLPEIGEEVIVYVPNSNRNKVTSLAMYIRYEGATEFHWDNQYGGSNIHLQNAVTHWQPLPKPPLK